MIDTAPLSPSNVAVVIPALNEALRIREVASGVLAAGFEHVIVVDDGSDDGTAQCLAGLPLTVVHHAQRKGKGEALRTGFAEAMRRGLCGVLTLDGDGQHAASDLPRLLVSANRHPGCIIIGARLRKRASQPRHRRLANALGDWGIAWGTHYQVVDSQSGQRFYPADVIALGNIPAEGFVFEAQVMISAARQLGTRCVSVPIESRYRCADSGEQFRPSHFRPLRDLYCITSHIVLLALRHGHVWQVYRRIRANPPLIDEEGAQLPTP